MFRSIKKNKGYFRMNIRRRSLFRRLNVDSTEDLAQLYKRIFMKHYNYKKNLFFLEHKTIFNLSLPFRQYLFSIRLEERDKFYSAGDIINIVKGAPKHYKRSHVGLNMSLLYFYKIYYDDLKKIYLFFIKNFNYKQYLFFFKFSKMFRPSVLYFLHKYSFIPVFTPKKRIKRWVLRSLGKT
jgi:hypothetical protein